MRPRFIQQSQPAATGLRRSGGVGIALLISALVLGGGCASEAADVEDLDVRAERDGPRYRMQPLSVPPRYRARPAPSAEYEAPASGQDGPVVFRREVADAGELPGHVQKLRGLSPGEKRLLAEAEVPPPGRLERLARDRRPSLSQEMVTALATGEGAVDARPGVTVRRPATGLGL